MAAAFEKEQRVRQDNCYKQNKEEIRTTYTVSTGYIKIHHYYDFF